MLQTRLSRTDRIQSNLTEGKIAQVQSLQKFLEKNQPVKKKSHYQAFLDKKACKKAEKSKLKDNPVEQLESFVIAPFYANEEDMQCYMDKETTVKCQASTVMHVLKDYANSEKVQNDKLLGTFLFKGSRATKPAVVLAQVTNPTCEYQLPDLVGKTANDVWDACPICEMQERAAA